MSATLVSGTVDTLGVFGVSHANLGGQTITINIGYDYTTLLANATSGVNGSNKFNPYTNGVEEGFNDAGGDGQEFVTAIVGGNVFSLADSGSNVDQTEICSQANCGGSSTSFFQQGISNSASNLQITPFLRDSLAPADLGTVSAMDNYFSNLTGTGYIFLNNGSSGGAEILNFSNATLLASSATPEPSTWGSLALGLAAALLVTRSRKLRNSSAASRTEAV